MGIGLALATAIPSKLPTPIQTTWNCHAKSYDKVTKRMLTGAEAAKKDANAAEAAKRKAIKETETTIDNELLTGIEAAAAESSSESNASEAAEVVFTTPISPLQRKRTHTLVMRTPNKPRATLLVPTTPTESIELPVSTVPARPDGRTRREGKNAEYIRAIDIVRGRGRGGRGGHGNA